MSEVEISCGTGLNVRPTVEGLITALDAIEQTMVDPFVIIARSGQHYMQCLNKSGWKLEKREGSDDTHFKGSRAITEAVDPEKLSLLEILAVRREVLSSPLIREDIEEAMTAYLLGHAEPDWIIWTRIDV